MHLKKYKYVKTDYAEVIEKKTINELAVPIVSWLPVEKDLGEFYIDMLTQVNVAIDENNKTQTPEQVAFEMNTKDPYRRDVQMDGVFEKYKNRRSFVEKIYCPNKYAAEEITGITYFTQCKFMIKDTNEDFHLLFNINDNPLPEDYVTRMEFSHTCVGL